MKKALLRVRCTTEKAGSKWRMAERFGADYWLYVGYSTGTTPALKAVRDPLRNLPIVEEKEIVRYIVPPESVRTAAGAS